MLARFTDVITDPIMGEISNSRTRFGRRKPWILVGMPIMMYGVYKLFIPPEGWVWYFLVYLTMFFLGSTIIAYRIARGGRVVCRLPQRSRHRSQSFRARRIDDGGYRSDGGRNHCRWCRCRSGFLRTLARCGGAFTGDFSDKKSSIGQHNRACAHGLAYTILVVLPVCVFIVLTAVRPPATTYESAPLREGIRYLWKNGPMRRVLIIALMVIFGEAFRNAVSLFFIRDIVGVPTIGAAYFYFIAGWCDSVLAVVGAKDWQAFGVYGRQTSSLW